MKAAFHRLSVRQRLTLTYAALFLLAGAILLALNYTLMSQQLPLPSSPIGVTGTQPITPGMTVTVGPGELQVIVNDVRDKTLNQLLIQSSIALSIMAVVSTLLGWFVAGRIVKPLREMTATARRLSEHNLVLRLAIGQP